MTWAPDYVTAEELAAYVRVNNSDDPALAPAIAAASRAIDDATKRQFGQVASPVARIYTARWKTALERWVVDVDDLQDTTGMTVEFGGDAITAYTLRPGNAVADGRPYQQITVLASSDVTPTAEPDGVTVTARWGWTEVPEPVKQACLMQASRFMVRRNSPFGVAGSPEAGTEIRLLARLDPDVAVALRPYVNRVGRWQFA